MPAFRFKYVDSQNVDGVWEQCNENCVKNQLDAEKLCERWITDFNDLELRRYGDRAHLRKINIVEFIGDGPLNHEWNKLNSITIGNDGHGHRDKWACKVCGCEGLRYGLSGTIKRIGKWKGKKFETCHGAERPKQ